MLKSTYKPAGEPQPLPPGWTEHKAPTGHTYYYNASTKQSTYTRPAPLPEKPALTPSIPPYTAPGFQTAQGGFNKSFGPGGPFPNSGPAFAQNFGSQTFQKPSFEGHRHHEKPQHRTPEDRPKHKQAIPGCNPWLLIRTKLGRRFVYNPELGESFWKFPPEVLKCVIELDRVEREKRQRRERGEPSPEPEKADNDGGKYEKAAGDTAPQVKDYGSDEYEEVEVTDDEDEGVDGPNKRPRMEGDEPVGPIEFNEDDIAYQLAAMNQDDDEDYGEGEGDWDIYEEPPLDETDAIGLFKDLLNDFHINPYTPWENIIEEGKIIEDERYTCLPNTKRRKEAWSEWSRDAIQKLKEQRERQEKKDPRIPYLAFLQKNATPKLYWPEFRRKYQKEPEMRDRKLMDKDREKLYREHINRLKLPESTLKADLTSLLKAQPLALLNRGTNLSALPPPILTDLRYISLRPSVRDPMIEGYISLLPPAPEHNPEDLSPEEEAERQKEKEERERREKALAERERRVQEEKRRLAGQLRYSKGVLRDEEEEVQRAMRVGRAGLLKQLEEPEIKKDG